MLTDEELLRAFTEGQSETAFAKLVERHVDLVYSTALRVVAESQLAQDVAQAVFIHLARKAGSIRNPTALSGWLYRVTSCQAANCARNERRRRRRELDAVKMNPVACNESMAWTEITPLLEEAMRTLARKDQDAVVLRYFRGRSLREVGEALSMSEDAAQKRISRALERLRTYFSDRGVRVSAGVLAGSIAAHAVQAAPVGMGAAISTAVVMSGAALHGTAILSFAKLGLTQGIVMTTTQKLAITATLGLAVGAGIYEAHQAGQMRAKLQEAERQLQPLTAQASQLRHERDQISAKLKDAQAQIGQLQRNSSELLRLRGEVARLRNDARELDKLKAQSPAISPALVMGAASPTNETVSSELAARVALLQQNLRQRPERQIPELQFADEKDWLEAAKLVKSESDVDMRKGLSLLRTLAKFKFGPLLSSALLKFTEANNGGLPVDVIELKPFISVPVDDAILQRYEMMASGNTSNPDFDPHKPVIKDKTGARIDPVYDASLMVSLTGAGGGGGPNTVFPNRLSDSSQATVVAKGSGAAVTTSPDGSAQVVTKPDSAALPNP